MEGTLPGDTKVTHGSSAQQCLQASAGALAPLWPRRSLRESKTRTRRARGTPCRRRAGAQTSDPPHPQDLPLTASDPPTQLPTPSQETRPNNDLTHRRPLTADDPTHQLALNTNNPINEFFHLNPFPSTTRSIKSPPHINDPDQSRPLSNDPSSCGSFPTMPTNGPIHQLTPLTLEPIHLDPTYEWDLGPTYTLHSWDPSPATMRSTAHT